VLPPRAPLILVLALGPGVVLAPCAACGGADRDAKGVAIEVMSFNLRWGPDPAPEDWEARGELVTALLRKEAPDVVGLQESRDEFVKDLLQGLPEYAAYPDQGDRRNAVLYRADRLRLDRETSDSENARVDAPEKDWGIGSVRLPRAARFVDKESGRGFYVYNNHMDHRYPESRAWSAQVLIDRIRGRRIDDPVILTGDFNAIAAGPAMRFLRGEAPLQSGEDAVSNPIPFVDTWRHQHADATASGTYHRFVGARFGPRVDYVLAGPGIRVREARILRDEWDGRYPSDHFPVSAKLVLP
jgi:endonuclease/exonuclease/phosphatase family metal-dependent hydrolase